MIRLDGTNAEEGRAILADAGISDRAHSAADHARRRPRRRRARRTGATEWRSSSTRTPRSSYQGLTGGQGRFYGLRNRDYGTQVVGRRHTRARAAPDVEGIPVFDTVAEAVAATGADRVVHRRPAARRASAAILEAAEAGIEFIVVHHRGHPGPGRGLGLQHARSATTPSTRLLGPNCPGIISPGKCNIGITAGEIAKRRRGRPDVGIVSRSGTLTYQALYELKQKGIGVTTCVGIGGDPVPGT